MTDADLQNELKSIKERLEELAKPQGPPNTLVLRLQNQLKTLALQVEAQKIALQELLHESDFQEKYEAAYKKVRTHDALHGEADYESW